MPTFRPRQPLPIDPLLPELKAAMEDHPAVVLQAPPGAGKTTHVPLALLDAQYLRDQRILLLEPRRLAARAAAYRMADLLGERVGETVGYRMRLDSKVGPRTRIEVVTEGILTRMLLDDPALEGVGVVIFDEFHERSLAADVGLVLCRQVQEVLRDDLRLLVMSATLATEALVHYLDGAPLLESEGRSYPIETIYLGHAIRGQRVEGLVAGAVREALQEHEGDVLVFLPGAGEIRRTADLLAGSDLPTSVQVHPLFGHLTRRDQDRAIAPAPPGQRKVVLATSIAETSLTIEGVRVVVDSGLMRVPQFDPGSGMTRLVTRLVTRDAADQRQGRAGRTAPGVCYRLWSAHEQQHLVPHRTPEILVADLAPLALDLACWGVQDPGELNWLDAPPSAAWSQSKLLITDLGALGKKSLITDVGKRMAALPTHPRLAHMLLEAKDHGYGALAADVAALMDERDVLRRREGPAAPDLRLRLELLQDVRTSSGLPRSWHHHEVAVGTLQRVQQTAQRWRQHLRLPRNASGDPLDAGRVLAWAYPDRIAQNLGTPGQFRLRDGRRAQMDEADPVAHAPFVVAAAVDGKRQDTRIFLATPLDADDLERLLADQIVEEADYAWDRTAQQVRATEVRRLGALVLHRRLLPHPDQQKVADVVLTQVQQHGLHVLPWTKAATQVRERLAFLHHHLGDDWPDVSDAHLLATLPEWLGPHVYGMQRFDDLRRLDLKKVLLTPVPWSAQQRLDTLAPERLPVPSGSRIRIDYSDAERPVLAVRLQEVFGMTETPRLAGGRVPVVMHLLSPAQRPVQVTQDLANFWTTSYFDVRKDMRGRYPKHYWPEDPMKAQATRHVRPRR